MPLSASACVCCGVVEAMVDGIKVKAFFKHAHGWGCVHRTDVWGVEAYVG
ncbi:hypothetical protein ACOWKN_00415 [Helicobacter pylori]